MYRVPRARPMALKHRACTLAHVLPLALTLTPTLTLTSNLTPTLTLTLTLTLTPTPTQPLTLTLYLAPCTTQVRASVVSQRCSWRPFARTKPSARFSSLTVPTPPPCTLYPPPSLHYIDCIHHIHYKHTFPHHNTLRTCTWAPHAHVYAGADASTLLLLPDMRVIHMHMGTTCTCICRCRRLHPPHAARWRLPPRRPRPEAHTAPRRRGWAAHMHMHVVTHMYMHMHMDMRIRICTYAHAQAHIAPRR